MANLRAFLTKLDEEMRQTSQDYRTATGNKKTTTLVYRSKEIRDALNTLMAANLNNSKDKKAAPIKLNENAKKKYNNLVRKLSNNIKTIFNVESVKLRKSDEADGIVTTFRGGITFTVIEQENSQRDNYKFISDAYKRTLDKFYQDFLVIIKKPEGIIRESKSNKETGTTTVGTAGAAFNLSHVDASNVLHQMNDAVYDALAASYGKSSNVPAKVEADLRKALGKDAETILTVSKMGKLGEVKVGISAAWANTQQGGGKLEQGIATDLKKVLEKLDIPKIKGSDSLEDAHRKKLVKELVKPFKRRKSVKVKHEDFTIKESRKPETVKTKQKVSVKNAALANLAAKKAVRRTRQGKTPPPRMGLSNILGVLNGQLPNVVAKNMGSPRLENRTGRFAQSVRATDVTQTPQGFPSIGYTYMKERYGVYESTSGTRFADTERDPRPLIDQSIREIVIGFGLGRIYTRRQ